MPRFAERVKAGPPVSPMLPLSHCCDAYEAIPIFEKRELATTMCDVFEEELLYLFYGKPAFRSGTSDGNAVGLSSFFPVCFLVDSSAIPKPKRIYPFDSGAFSLGYYKEFCHPRMQMSDFLLGDSLELAAKCVGLFYTKNESYFYGDPNDETPVAGNFEEESFRALISCPRLAKTDDRKSAIEIQLDSNVILRNGVVRLVIMPAFLADVPSVQAAITTEWSCECRTYLTYTANPLEFHSTLMKEVGEFLKSSGHY